MGVAFDRMRQRLHAWQGQTNCSCYVGDLSFLDRRKADSQRMRHRPYRVALLQRHIRLFTNPGWEIGMDRTHRNVRNRAHEFSRRRKERPHNRHAGRLDASVTLIRLPILRREAIQRFDDMSRRHRIGLLVDFDERNSRGFTSRCRNQAALQTLILQARDRRGITAGFQHGVVDWKVHVHLPHEA